MDLADIFPRNGRQQGLYCEACGSSMDLHFDDFSEMVSGIQIDISGLPFLHCDKCATNALPDDSRFAIIHLHQQAVEKLSEKVSVRRTKKVNDFGFSKVPFLMDADDYFYIPGLYRAHDVGFLTPLFFNKAVLAKYDNSPDYSVRFASPTYGEIDAESFAVPFGINKFGKVIMWLGDVVKLPEAEQYYLRSENVASDHSLGSEFYDAQIECKFTDPPKERLAIGQRSNFIDAFEKKFGVWIDVRAPDRSEWGQAAGLARSRDDHRKLIQAPLNATLLRNTVVEKRKIQTYLVSKLGSSLADSDTPLKVIDNCAKC